MTNSKSRLHEFRTKVTASSLCNTWKGTKGRTFFLRCQQEMCALVSFTYSSQPDCSISLIYWLDSVASFRLYAHYSLISLGHERKPTNADSFSIAPSFISLVTTGEPLRKSSLKGPECKRLLDEKVTLFLALLQSAVVYRRYGH